MKTTSHWFWSGFGKLCLSFLCLITLAFCLPGCVSSSSPSTSSDQQSTAPDKIDRTAFIASAIQPICKNVVLPVLAKNPRYEAALLALADGADAALQQTELTPEAIHAFVDALGRRFDLSEDAKLYIASGIDDLVKFYQQTYGAQVASTTDPRVKAILAAFSRGIRDGVAFYRAMSSAAAQLEPRQAKSAAHFYAALGAILETYRQQNGDECTFADYAAWERMDFRLQVCSLALQSRGKQASAL